MENQLDRNTMHALLDEIKKVATHASLTGSMRKGTAPLVNVYNQCLSALSQGGDSLVETLFPRLDPAAANIDEIGMIAALLARYVRHSTDDDHGYILKVRPSTDDDHEE